MTTRDNVRARLTALASTEPSKQAFADKCGVSRQAVNSWLTGAATPDIERLAFIAKTYHLPISAFLDEDGNNAESIASVQDGILLDYFHRLSAEGKEYVLRAAQTAVASGLYR